MSPFLFRAFCYHAIPPCRRSLLPFQFKISQRLAPLRPICESDRVSYFKQYSLLKFPPCMFSSEARCVWPSCSGNGVWLLQFDGLSASDGVLATAFGCAFISFTV